MMTKSYAASSSLDRWGTVPSNSSNSYQNQSFHSVNLQNINRDKSNFESNLLQNFNVQNRYNLKECSSDNYGSCLDNYIDISSDVACNHISDHYHLSKSRINKCTALVLPRYVRTYVHVLDITQY